MTDQNLATEWEHAAQEAADYLPFVKVPEYVSVAIRVPLDLKPSDVKEVETQYGTKRYLPVLVEDHPGGEDFLGEGVIPLTPFAFAKFARFLSENWNKLMTPDPAMGDTGAVGEWSAIFVVTRLPGKGKGYTFAMQ